MTEWNDPDDWEGEPEENADEPSAPLDPDDDGDDDEPEDDAEDEDLDTEEEEDEEDVDDSDDDDLDDDLDDESFGQDQSSDLLLDDDLEDEFVDFIDEELGYAEIDWDTLPQDEVDEHERLLEMSQEELDGVDLSELGDFARWGVARAYLAHGDEIAFETTALPLLSSKDHYPALDYVDITLALMSRKAKREDFDSAFGLLERLSDISGGDEALVKRFRGILTIQKGNAEEGLELLAQLAETQPDDPSFLLSLGEDLCGIGLWEEAVEYLEIAEELARQNSDQDLLSSIENAVQFAQRQMGFDDVDEF